MDEQIKQDTPQAAPEFAEDFSGDPSSQSILERLNRRPSPVEQAASSDVARCPVCGSEWFAELQFQQYRADVYSYGPGGDLQVMSPTSFPVRFCLCGYILEPSLTSQGIGRGTMSRLIDSFGESFQKAMAFRNTVTQRAQQAITVAEMKPRDELLAEVKNFVDRIRKRLTAEKKDGKETKEE